ncbi:MAG: hypothetical protein DME98_14345 [Verrucomicrobia bacterium]|nr:MAG: hypothetical protein DME98_14345 [Verrucomicrobiota bacterium]PYJ33433.1 MAG: hypothetical protein DME88_08435 [Verrucomicrobiota bacterium]
MVELKERLIHQKSAVSMMNMNRKVSLHVATTTAAFFFMTSSLVRGQTAQTSPASMARGDEAMGFDQEKTTHHFKLLPDGGTIEISANDPSDVATREAIQRHVAKTAGMFAQGDFSIPMLVHKQAPPGVDMMKRLKGELSYTPENLPNGGRVQITTSNSEALNAVHDFLRFQIQEHKTGDSLADPRPAKRKHPANNLGKDAHPAPP